MGRYRKFKSLVIVLYLISSILVVGNQTGLQTSTVTKTSEINILKMNENNNLNTGSPASLTYPFKTYVANISLMGSLIAERDSSVLGENIQLVPLGSSGDWNIITRDNAMIDIRNLTHSVEGNLNIYAFDSSIITIRNSVLPNLYIYLYNYSQVYIENSYIGSSIYVFASDHSSIIFKSTYINATNLGDIIMVMGKNYSKIVFDGVSVMSSSISMFSLTDFSGLYMYNSNFLNGYEILNARDYSIVEFHSVNASSPSNQIDISIDGYANMRVFNSTLKLGFSGINVYFIGSIEIYDSEITSTLGWMNLATIGNVSIVNSFVSNISVVFPEKPYGLGFRVGPNPTIKVHSSHIIGLVLSGSQRVLLSNSTIDDLSTVLWFFGGINITDNIIYMLSGTIGPYPFINSGSIINSMSNITTFGGWTIVLASGVSYVKNSSIDQLTITDAIVNMNDSEVYYIYSFNSFVDFRNNTLPLGNIWSIQTWNSTFLISNMANLTLMVNVYTGPSKFKITDSTILSFTIISPIDVICDIDLTNSVLEDGYFVYISNLNLASQTIFTGLTEKTGLTGGYMFIEAAGYLEISNSTISFLDLQANSVFILVDNSTLTVLSPVILWSNSVFMSNSSSFDGKIEVLGSSLAYFFENSWVRELFYVVNVNNSVEILNGYIVGGLGYSANAFFDSTSSANIAVPKIYANSYVEVNDSYISALYYSNGTQFYLKNVTLYTPPSGGDTGIMPIFNPVTGDPRSMYVSGKIEASSLLTGSVILIGYGDVLINNTDIGFLLSVFTNTTVLGGTIGYLIDVYYAYTGTASIINDVPSGFDGSYVSYTSTVIAYHYFGVLAQNTSYVNIYNSSIAFLGALDSSTIEANTFYPIDTPTFGFFIVYVSDFGNITISNFDSTSSIDMDLSIVVKQFGYLGVLSSNVSTTIYAFNLSNVYVENSTIGYIDFAPTGGIMGFDSPFITMYNSTIYNLQVWANGNAIILANNITINYVQFFNGIIGSQILAVFKNSVFNNVFSLSMVPNSIDVSLIDSYVVSSGLLFAQNSNVNVTGSTSQIYFPGLINVIDSNLVLFNVNVSFTYAMFSNISAIISSLGMLMVASSNVNLFSSNATYIAIGEGTTFTSNNSAIAFLFGVELIGYGSVMSTFEPDNTLIIADTEFNLVADELTVYGVGFFNFNGGSYSTSLYATATNITDTFSNTVIQWKPMVWLVNFYVDSRVIATIANFETSSNRVVGVIKVSYLKFRLPPIIVIRLNSTIIHSGSTITIELGASIGNITFTINSSTIIESYELYLDGSLIESGPITDLGYIVEIDPTSYINSTGLYNLTLRVVDVDGNINSVTIFIDVKPSQPPQITRVPIEDIEFEIGMIVSDIEWTITDVSPTMYEILINGSVAISGLYSSGDTIIFDVVGNLTSPGTYNITIVAYDAAGNKSSDTIIVTAYPSKEPEITSKPNDTTININDTIKLNWTATDRYPDTYDIYINGTKVVSDAPWSSGTPVSFSFSKSTSGTYNITIVFKDKAGNKASDTVIITVVQPTGGPGGGVGIPGDIIGIIVIIIIILGGIILMMYRRRK